MSKAKNGIEALKTTSFQIVNRRFNRDQYVKLSTYGQDKDENTKNILKKILQKCKLHDTCKQNRWLQPI